jgi:predicted NBD/HSP70 family sugar kinase
MLNNDSDALAVADAAGQRMGQGMALLVDALNPQVIVLGSLAVALGERILAPARQVVAREALPEAVAIFIAPASFEQLRERLQERGVDDAAGVERRLAIARTELAAREEFGFVVVNDDVERAVAELDAIYVRYAG